jgi:hypothetical protein
MHHLKTMIFREQPSLQIYQQPQHTIFQTQYRGSSTLSTSMIDRVYKAKSGCSACGKKVA